MERIVEKPYEIIVENEIENIIENRYYVDTEVEKIVNRDKYVDVEKIVEKKKYIKKEQVVEVEKYVEVPYEVIEEFETPYYTEVGVPQERVVNKYIDKIIVRPHRTEIIENQIVVDKEVPMERIV